MVVVEKPHRWNSETVDIAGPQKACDFRAEPDETGKGCCLGARGASPFGSLSAPSSGGSMSSQRAGGSRWEGAGSSDRASRNHDPAVYPLEWGRLRIRRFSLPLPAETLRTQLGWSSATVGLLLVGSTRLEVLV